MTEENNDDHLSFLEEDFFLIKKIKQLKTEDLINLVVNQETVKKK